MEGNQMKMREALELCAHEMCKYCRKAAVVENLVIPCLEGCETQRIAKAALAAPLRQCDVGTVEEQSDRFANLCDSHSGCSQCPVKSLWNFANGHNPSCGVLWAQTPYEAEEGGAE